MPALDDLVMAAVHELTGGNPDAPLDEIQIPAPLMAELRKELAKDPGFTEDGCEFEAVLVILPFSYPVANWLTPRKLGGFCGVIVTETPTPEAAPSPKARKETKNAKTRRK